MPENKQPEEFYSEKELAELLKCSCSRLQKDRYAGRGVPYVKWGRSVLYRKCDVEQYIRDHMVKPICAA
jgi:hypothetical protein